MKSKKFSIVLYYFLSLIYLEFLFRGLLFSGLFRLSNINMILYLAFLSCILGTITNFFKSKINKVIFYIILIFFGVWFSAQYIVKSVFDFFISFSVLQLADQIGGFFFKETVLAVLARIVPVILFFLPLIISIFLRKKLRFERQSFKKFILKIILAGLFFCGYYGSLSIGKKKAYSPYELFHNVNSPALNIKKVGVMNTLGIDLYRVVFGFDEKIIIQKDTKKEKPKETKYEYNNLNIDFEGLKASTSDSILSTMNEYFENETGTLQNKYTNFFKDKNLILFMGESFNEIAVDEEITPTLYKLANNGFVFNDFYTLTNGSTLGGEFQELTGILANIKVLPQFRNGTNYFPMGLGTVFAEAGYNTFAYHDHYYTFQDRNQYLKSLGFTNFKGCYNGMENLINCKSWPESDVEMIEATTPDFINSEKPFMVFYASVSGHGNYTWMGNLMAKKHKEDIETFNLGYSDNTLAYLAAQMEFDQALELLIQKLDEAGKLDDTVIVIAGDHYPYMLTVDQVNEAADYKKDAVIEINHSNLIIYNSAMKNVEVDKVTSQVDILPTIYNLFGIKYDSRLFIGNDALSTEEGLAIFENRSWASDKGKYFADTGVFDGEADEEYINNMNNIVNNKVIMSKYLIEKNYYKVVWPYVK